MTSKNTLEYRIKDINYYAEIGLTNYDLQKTFFRPSRDLQEKALIIKETGFTKFNLGCAKNPMSAAQGWLNIDFYPYQSNEYKFLHFRTLNNYKDKVYLNHDLSKGIPAFRNSLELVYHSLLMDCFDYETSLMLLDQIYESLKLGGKHRLVVLDMEALLRIYPTGKSLIQKIERNIFETEFGSDHSDIYPNAASSFSKLLHNQKLKSFWSRESVFFALKKTGFQNIQSREMTDSEDPDIISIEKQYSDFRRNFCLFFECEKQN
jgi:hypothetical protein